jgi:hypothetical protein
MTIGGKLIVAKVIEIYPLNIAAGPNLNSLRDRKSPIEDNVVRWAWRDAAHSGKWMESPGWLLAAFAFAADTEVACT